jgi:nucleotide-binding universal stress UspA family protein
MGKPIVIAVDGSPAADQATVVGLDLAVAQDAPVVFVHFSPEASPVFESAAGEPSQEQIERADAVLSVAARSARDRGVEYLLEIADEHKSGDIAASIAGIAEGRDAGLIVVGTRGRGMIAGVALGSVSHGLLSVARVPVVVAHAAAPPSHSHGVERR